jgi:hypothetical protein
MIHGQPVLAHHFLKIPVAERVAAVPSDAEQDYIRRVVTPLEWRIVASHGLVMSRTCDDKEGKIIAEKQFLKHNRATYIRPKSY